MLFIVNGNGFEMGYCSNNGEYAKETIDNDPLIEMLRTHNPGDAIRNAADLIKINTYLTSKGIHTQCGLLKKLGMREPSLIKQGHSFSLYAESVDSHEWNLTALPAHVKALSLDSLPYTEKRTGWFNAGAWIDSVKTWEHSWAYLPFDGQYLPLYDALYDQGVQHPSLSLEHHGAYYAS